MRLFALCGSLSREGSLNMRLLELAVERARSHGVELDARSLREFEMPLYCDEDRRARGFPPGSEALKRELEGVDGVLIASPEYNFSIPGPLKNAIDWTSRYRPVPWDGKHALLLAASPSATGGHRGLWQLRAPLCGLGVHVYPEVFALALAGQAFDSDGKLAEADLCRRLEQTVDGFLNLVRRVVG